jgi:hypothetical protein
MIRGLSVQAKTPAVLSPRSSLLDAGDFENLFQLMLLDLIAALEKFSQSEKRRSVYAIGIGIHEEGYIPSLLINGQEDAPRLDEGERLDVYQEKYCAVTFQSLSHCCSRSCEATR